MELTQVHDAMALIRLEYAEMPGLRLTFWQAQRLWNFTEEVCDAALRALTQSGFLRCTAQGFYVSPL